MTNRLVFVTLLLTRPASMATSLGTIAEIALPFLAAGFIPFAVVTMLGSVGWGLLMIIRLVRWTGTSFSR